MIQIDVNVLLAAGLLISFYLHYRQSEINKQEKKVEHHTYNNIYGAEIIEEDERMY